MNFMTPVDLSVSEHKIDHNTELLFMGSCFAENIGERLVNDGFNVSVNPMGILFNPSSIAKVISRALSRENYTFQDLVEYNGIWHCLDFSSRRQDPDPDRLLESLNNDFNNFANIISNASTWIITFGTSWVFDFIKTGEVVGNCHKLPINQFYRHKLEVNDIVDLWHGLCRNRRIIFTVSPVRHLADGMHGNTISKATLHLAIDKLCENTDAEYFPSFEIVNDQLRDYRFYAADMKHPSDVAVDFIYDRFASVYFSNETRMIALDNRRNVLRQNHRPIL